MALAAVLTGTSSWVEAGTQVVFVSLGGVAIGLAIGWLAAKIHPFLDRRGLSDPKSSITITLLTPFAAYLPAEAIHVSGVFAVVAAGLYVGNRCEQVFTKETYAEAKAVWEWIDFLLNSLIFILIGFQIRPVLDNLKDDFLPGQLASYAAAISLVVIVVRLLWVYPAAYVPRILPHIRRREPFPSPRGVFVTGWTGLRGVVSLAVALAIPLKLPDQTPFPYRDLILFLTFCVIVATLVGQGLTLPLVIRWLHVDRLAPAGNEPAAGDGTPSDDALNPHP